jgi:hypothetical protein
MCRIAFACSAFADKGYAGRDAVQCGGIVIVGKRYVACDGIRWVFMGMEQGLRTKLNFPIRDYKFLGIRFIDNFSRLIEEV